AISLGIGFVEHHCRVVVALEITEAARLVGEPVQYSNQLTGMQSWQAGSQRLGAVLVIQASKQRQLLAGHTNDAIRMAFQIPLILLVLDAAHTALAGILI